MNSFFSDVAKETILSEISLAADNEVFFVGTTNTNGAISSVKAVARGNKYSVPAIIDSADSGQVVIHNHPSGNLTPSDQDINMASVFGNKGVGFYIIDNLLTDIYIVVEPFKKKEYEYLNSEELTKAFSAGGIIESALSGKYEYREEQIYAMKQFADSFNNNSISIVEAGTGTGKTLSYLLPAIEWSIKNSERVVISTNTINLQEQIIGKDLPILKKTLDSDFTYSLVKGMKNYLCLLRCETVTEGLFDLAEDGEENEIDNILNWSKITEEGSLSDLNFTPRHEVWDKFAAESESCIRSRCPHYSKCFFFKARRELSSSQLLIVNHHLFFSDLSIKDASDNLDTGILPPYNRVIFDEAHNIVDAATSHFSLRISRYGLLRVVRKLKSKSKKGGAKGLVFYAATTALKLPEELNNSPLDETLNRIEEVISPRVDSLELAISEAFDSIYSLADSLKDSKDHIKEINIRVRKDIDDSDEWKFSKSKFSELYNLLHQLIKELRYFIEILEQYESKADLTKLIVEINGVANKTHYYSEVIDSFFKQQDDSFVKWIECKVRGENILSTIGLSPIDVSSNLKEKLYENCKTLIMTSATLAVDKNFKFQKAQLGLENNLRLSELLVESPFNYKEQALLSLPTDIPEPKEKLFQSSIHSSILDSLLVSNGNAFVLFTSYALLEKVYSQISNELENQGMNVLKQGSVPRNKLLEKFKKTKNPVLFATDSFWEGVDIAGDSLQLVIITRLPFRVPTDPIIEARVDRLEKQGINSFMNYLVPLAILKFKQGFGRLIRTKTDKGVVLILDKRIVSKQYGSYFINSLPDCMKIRGKLDSILPSIKKFLS